MKPVTKCLFGGALVAAGLSIEAQCELTPGGVVVNSIDQPYEPPYAYSSGVGHTFANGRLYVIQGQYFRPYGDDNYIDEARLQVWNVDDLQNPVLLSESAPIEGIQRDDVDGFAVLGSMMYVAVARNVTAYDITDPLLPQPVATVTLPRSVVDLNIHQGTLFATTFVTTSVSLISIDISNPTQLMILDTYTGQFLTFGRAMDGRIVATRINIGPNDFVVLDVSDPGNLTELSRNTLGVPSDTSPVLVGNTAVFSRADGQVNIVVDVSDPANPIRLADFSPPFRPTRIRSSGLFVYYANNERVAAVDFSDPTMPVVVVDRPLGEELNRSELEVGGGVVAVMEDNIAGFFQDNVANGRIELFDSSPCSLPPAFLQSPLSRLVDAGPVPEVFSVVDRDVIDFQWLRDGEAIDDGELFSGTMTPDLSIVPNDQTIGVYTCRGTNPDGSTTSAPAFLGVRPAPSCPADQNFDGVLNGADFNAWLFNFSQGCP